MKQLRLLMGMPITVEIVEAATASIFDRVFDYLKYVDNTFSVYKENSEISRFNRGEIEQNELSQQMKNIFKIADNTKEASGGFFDIYNKKKKIIDPSGIVKGWAILNAADIIKRASYNNYYVEAGGDIQVAGRNAQGKKWRVGVRNPYRQSEIIKVVTLGSQGIATSGSYFRGQHVYNPHSPNNPLAEIVSISVIGPNILDADRFATAAFAMGADGINFIEKLKGFEGYQVNRDGVATQTTNFLNYVLH